MTQPPLLALRGIGKRFGGFAALDQVDFELRAGEIHALLGENGAGKSTLIKILGGIHAPDAGSILIDGQPVTVGSVSAADRLGIRVIHQELTLAPNLSVAENIYLGREPGRFGFLSRWNLRKQAATLLRELGLADSLPVDAVVSSLSTAQQQLVEIARALSARARILVLDEPTASLSQAETEMLFARLLQLRQQGVGLIYISHRLEEIKRLADRVTVLRDGRRVGTQDLGSLDSRELIRWMVGREMQDHYPRPTTTPGEVVLRVEGLRASRVHGVSLELRRGEILGLAGLVGAGRTDLARALFGMNPITDGVIYMEGRAITVRSPAEARRHGLVMVSEDRRRDGIIAHRSVAFNAALPWTAQWLPGCWPNYPRRDAIVQRVVRDFAVRVNDVNAAMATLSGGNQQKVVVGRWMEQPPRVLILDEPTRGVDVGAREDMFRTIHRLAEQGLAVLLISSDLPEVLHLSHRVGVYRDGRIVKMMPAAEATPEAVMTILTGGSTP